MWLGWIVLFSFLLILDEIREFLLFHPLCCLHVLLDVVNILLDDIAVATSLAPIAVVEVIALLALDHQSVSCEGIYECWGDPVSISQKM